MSKVNMVLPYFMFGEDMPHIEPYNIDCSNEDKRMRVYSGQLMDTVLENITLDNYTFHVDCYHRAGERLIKRFPGVSERIEADFLIFWSKVQTKLKQMKEAK